jgi:hypothetical protein
VIAAFRLTSIRLDCANADQVLVELSVDPFHMYRSTRLPRSGV